MVVGEKCCAVGNWVWKKVPWGVKCCWWSLLLVVLIIVLLWVYLELIYKAGKVLISALYFKSIVLVWR